MNERAPAKINVCLFLGPQRADGRHELVTIFQPIALLRRGHASSPPIATRSSAKASRAEPRRGRGRARSARRRGTPIRCASRSASASRSPAGWPAAPPTPRRRCGCSRATAAWRRTCTRSRPSSAPTCPARSRPRATSRPARASGSSRSTPSTHTVSSCLPGPEPLSTGAVFAKAAEMGLRRSPDDLADRWPRSARHYQDLPDALAVQRPRARGAGIDAGDRRAHGAGARGRRRPRPAQRQRADGARPVPRSRRRPAR